MKTLTNIPTSQLVHKAVACLMLFCIINMPVWAIQNGDYTSDGGNTINITDNVLTDIAINSGVSTIEWTNFDTIAGEKVNFSGQGGNFTVLNNITSTNITNFAGNLNGGGGHIIIINPNGLVFGPTATVTAGQFTASTLAIENLNDFVNGTGTFMTADTKGMIELQNGSKIEAHKINLIAQDIINSGQLVSDNGTVLMAVGDQVILTNTNDDIAVMVYVDNPQPIPDGEPQYNVTNNGTVDAGNGKVVLAAGDTFAQALDRRSSLAASVQSGEYSAYQNGDIVAGSLEVSAINQVQSDPGSTVEAGSIDIAGTEVVLNEALKSEGDMEIFANNSVSANGELTSGGSMSITADNYSISLSDQATAEGGDMLLDAGESITLWDDIISEGAMTLNAPYGTISTGSMFAGSDIALNTDLILFGEGTQLLVSLNGDITIDGWVEKYSETGGELGILAKNDIQLNDYVANYMGGTAVISTDGKIASHGTDVLDVSIMGYSDDSAGYALPFSDSRTSVVVRSKADLIFSENAALIANGDFSDPVDFRTGADFLTVDEKIIGGFPREAGDGIHVAIYAGSKEGNVVLNSLSNLLVPHPAGETTNATVVVDAFKSVILETMGVPQSYDGFDFGGYRLEAVSRVTEWLGQAIADGTLPFAANPEIMEELLGNDYVMRGAGVVENNYKEAWVLEDMPATDVPPAPLQRLEVPELKGCPAQMDAAANELAVNTEDLQLMIASSMAMNPNIQPCEACSNLLTAAATLKDLDGTRMAALAQIFNTLAPADAPFTPEVQASIQTAFADTDDPQNALASEFADAFATYVAILDTDLKLPVGDPVALVMEKYGQGITGSDNPNIATYITVQIESTGNPLAQMDSTGGSL